MANRPLPVDRLAESRARFRSAFRAIANLTDIEYSVLHEGLVPPGRSMGSPLPPFIWWPTPAQEARMRRIADELSAEVLIDDEDIKELEKHRNG